MPEFEPYNWTGLAWGAEYRDRRADVVAQVSHSGEILRDEVGEDQTAYALSRYMSGGGRSRPVSWHDTYDSDSIEWNLPFWYEAYHAGSTFNKISIGHEAGFRAAHLGKASPGYLDGLIEMGARSFAAAAAWAGLSLQQRSREELLQQGMTGWITHGSWTGNTGISPASFRSDPGPHWPQERIIARAAELVKLGVTTLGFGYGKPGEADVAGNRERTTVLQELLQLRGYDIGSADGWHGPVTQGALRHWQRSQGEKVSGVWVTPQPVILPEPAPAPAPSPGTPPPPPISDAAAVKALTGGIRTRIDEIETYLDAIDKAADQ